jgi:hypothetical protein
MLPCLALSCFDLSCLVLPYLALPCLALALLLPCPCRALPSLAFPCLVFCHVGVSYPMIYRRFRSLIPSYIRDSSVAVVGRSPYLVFVLPCLCLCHCPSLPFRCLSLSCLCFVFVVFCLYDYSVGLCFDVLPFHSL